MATNPDRSRDNFLRIAEVRARTTLSSATIYRKIKLGTFPRSKRISAGLAAWYESDIVAWMEDPQAWRTGGPSGTDEAQNGTGV